MTSFQITTVENNAEKDRKDLDVTVLYDKIDSVTETFTISGLEHDIVNLTKIKETLDVQVASIGRELEFKEALLARINKE